MTRLKIEGMTCPHCAKAVTDALTRTAGVDAVKSVDLASGLAEVSGTASVDTLVAAVKAAGYQATPAD